MIALVSLASFVIALSQPLCLATQTVTGVDSPHSGLNITWPVSMTAFLFEMMGHCGVLPIFNQQSFRKEVLYNGIICRYSMLLRSCV